MQFIKRQVKKRLKFPRIFLLFSEWQLNYESYVTFESMTILNHDVLLFVQMINGLSFLVFFWVTTFTSMKTSCTKIYKCQWSLLKTTAISLRISPWSYVNIFFPNSSKGIQLSFLKFQIPFELDWVSSWRWKVPNTQLCQQLIERRLSQIYERIGWV